MKLRVDDFSAASYTPRIRVLIRTISGLAPLIATVLLACAARSEPPVPVVDYAAALDRVRAAAPTQPLWIAFDWEAREREARYTGQGAARIEAPKLARLDLFGPRGESYLSAALVAGELRLPPSAEGSLIPPPPLLWGALGIFQPPEGAEVLASTREGDRLRVEYRQGDERWTFEFASEKLRRVDWRGPDGARKSVELKGEGALDLPREAVYRDWNAFTELKLKLGKVEEVDSFPPDTWLLYAR